MNINDYDANICIKEEKAKTAKKCCVEGCEKVGKWHNRLQTYYLQKGMCGMHYHRKHRYNDVHFVQKIDKSYNSKHPLYKTYVKIIERCEYPKSPVYHRYGGRGITICQRWKGAYGFNNFLTDMGDKPTPKHTVDRIDVNGNYEPSNCRWATIHEQAANTRTNNKIVGVSFYGNRWNAELIVDNVKVLRKSFKCFGEAVKCRKKAEKEYNIYGLSV